MNVNRVFIACRKVEILTQYFYITETICGIANIGPESDGFVFISALLISKQMPTELKF